MDDYLLTLKRNVNDFFIYSVVPEEWKMVALAEGYPVGVVHRPLNVNDQGKRKRVFTIEYIDGQITMKKQIIRAYNTKGYVR